MPDILFTNQHTPDIQSLSCDNFDNKIKTSKIRTQKTVVLLAFSPFYCTFAANMEKIILGIDPGTNIMGYGVLKVKDNKAQLDRKSVV